MDRECACLRLPHVRPNQHPSECLQQHLFLACFVLVLFFLSFFFLFFLALSLFISSPSSFTSFYILLSTLACCCSLLSCIFSNKNSARASFTHTDGPPGFSAFLLLFVLPRWNNNFTRIKRRRRKIFIWFWLLFLFSSWSCLASLDACTLMQMMWCLVLCTRPKSVVMMMMSARIELRRGAHSRLGWTK